MSKHIPITAKIKITGGRLLSAKNAAKIIARSTRPTDKMGNPLPTPIRRYQHDPPYYQTWVIRKEAKGYCFQEVNHGGGICGHHQTVRALVIATLLGFGCGRNVIEFIE